MISPIIPDQNSNEASLPTFCQMNHVPNATVLITKFSVIRPLLLNLAHAFDVPEL
jgi:hypothetical protein